ncbi:MAG: hypothetical protein ACXVRJ_00620 [Gaiellaceae bacterium]
MTTVVVFRGRRHTLNGGGFTTPWLAGPVRLELNQMTEARRLEARLAVGFANLGYCRSYLPPPFTLSVMRR